MPPTRRDRLTRVETELNCTPRSVVEARRFIEAATAVWELDDLNAVATLLTSELVTNAILHARTAVRLVAERTASELVVEVWDHAPHTSALRPRVPENETGRGLLIVERLAARWGMRRAGRWKVVWFALPLAG